MLPKASAPLIDFTDIGMSNSTFIDTSSLEQKLLEMADIIGKRESALKVLGSLSTVDITDNVMADVRSGSMDTKTIIEKYATECTTQMEIITQTLTRQVCINSFQSSLYSSYSIGSTIARNTSRQ